jgi:trigger factor
MSLVSSKKVDTNKFELEVNVDSAAFKKGIELAYRKNVNKINVPGFRKGKAPKSIIESMYGKDFFYEEAVNNLYPDAYAEAVTEAGIEPVSHPSVEITAIDENGFSFKATVTVKPEVEVKNYKGLKATKKSVTVTAANVKEELDKMRERNGRMVSVDNRPAQDGDNTLIDFEGFVNDVAFDGGKGENYPLTLGSGQFIPGFEEQIVGHNIGEEFDVNVTFPAEYQAEELAGKSAVFKVKLNEIRTRELPELDDEFAKDVSDFDTLDELKADIKAKIKEAKEKEATADIENQLIDEVIKNMTAEIPEVMYENAIDGMIEDFSRRLQSQGMQLDLYLKYTGMDMTSFRKQFEEQAQKQVKIRLALEKIVELENIVPTEEEIEAEFDKMAETYKMPKEQIKSMIPAEEFAKDLAVGKAIDLVKDSAEVEGKKTARKTTAKKTKSDDAAEEKAE